MGERKADDLIHTGAELRAQSAKARAEIEETRRRMGQTINRSAEIVGESRNIARSLTETIQSDKANVRSLGATANKKGQPLLCPTCDHNLAFHSSRTDTTANGEAQTILVYLCVTCGFCRTTGDGRPLIHGM